MSLSGEREKQMRYFLSNPTTLKTRPVLTLNVHCLSTQSVIALNKIGLQLDISIINTYWIFLTFLCHFPRATVVESYRVYWTNISSSKILVIPGDEESNFINGRKGERTSEKKVIMNRSDMLGDYELVSDDDYHDMEGSDSRTISDRQEFQGFTVLPILENVIKDQDNPDQTDGNSHDTVNENESIDSSLVAHEISEEQTTEVPSRLSKGKSSENPRNRPSILITPPARPRNKKVSSTFATTSIKTSTATTPTSTSTSSTTNSIKNKLTSKKMSPPTTMTKKLPVTTSKVVSKMVEGGIVIKARRRNSSPRPILEPKFIFTTEASTGQTTTKAVTTSLVTTIQETSSSAIETSTTIEDILTAENTMFSHVFELTKETHDDNDAPPETQTEIVFHTISNSSNAREVQYNVHLEKDEGKTTVKSSIPSFDDLEVISKMISTTKSSLSSDLYEVKYSENATETILMGEITELERMPRDNIDNLEPLEGAYKRYSLQLRYMLIGYYTILFNV